MRNNKNNISSSNKKISSYSQKKIDVPQILMKKKITSNKIAINKNCLSNRSNLNSSCSLGGVKSSNFSQKKCITNNFLTRNRNINSYYNCRPNTLLSLSKNKKNTLICKNYKFSSVDNNINNNNSEIPLIKIRKKIMYGNTININRNYNLSNRSQNLGKIYSLKNNIIYNKIKSNIGLNSNIISNPFYVEENNKLSERPRIKVNTKPQNIKSTNNLKYPQNIYVNTINNKIDIINNINLNSNNSIESNSITKKSAKELNKHKIVDILSGKFSSNCFTKKSRNINSSTDLYTNAFDSNGNITTVYNKNLNFNNDSTANKLSHFYRSLDNNNNEANNIDIKITYHKKPTKKLKLATSLKSNSNYLEFKTKNNLNMNKKKVNSKNIINHKNIKCVVEENKINNNLNSCRNYGINGIIRTKFSNIYLRKKSGRKDDKNILKDINKKNNNINISYKSNKLNDGNKYPFLKNSKLVIKK